MTDLLSKNDAKTWSDFIQKLSEKVPETVHPWIMSLEPAMPLNEESENGIFLIKSSQSFAVRFLSEKHLPEIEKALFEITNIKRVPRIIFDENVKKKKAKLSVTEKEHIETAVKIENLTQMHSFCGLNLKYTFENFVIGENSKFAYKIAQMIAEKPGQKYNPLFISGDVGLGKTHLMQAIGHQILKNFSNLKIRYTQAEEFGNKLIESLKKSPDVNERMKKFRDMYRNIDVLLIDDIQYIENKPRTQEEIFNTFNALHQAGKQIIFASDRPLNAFETIPDRLKSRFEWGIEAKITVPDLETRTEIIKRHAINSEFPISNEVALFLAQEFNENIRELEGAYNKVSALASIEGIELTVDAAKEFLDLSSRKNKITCDKIMDICSSYFDVEISEILSSSRSKDITNARKHAIYLSREILNLSYPQLAQKFQKNHTTIMYQYEQLRKDVKINKATQLIIDELKQLIKK